jgi:DNA-binding CsgD family transcriptional regulator/N-acetylneuraminic acid mutarotase
LTDPILHDKLIFNMHNDSSITSPTELTEREKEILRLVATGTSNKDIAHQLFISSNTVKVHLRNIFAKIGVVSRTEAAVYAINAGLVNGIKPPQEGLTGTESLSDISKSRENSRKRLLIWTSIALFLVLAATASIYIIFQYRSNHFPPENPTQLVPQRWQKLANLPAARSGLAVAVYANRIYAIGGMTNQGISGIVEQYDPATDKWTTLPTKPVPVAYVSAAVIGGKIYIPGGRISTGSMTNILESYDPQKNLWEKHASLPVSLSGYALVAFEGKLYLAGGSDGEHILDSVFLYDPELDTWKKCAPMSTPREYAGAAVAGGKIYVVGGFDGKMALKVNEEYSPNQNTWSERKELPVARYAMGMTSIADLVYVIGGQGKSSAGLDTLQYSYQQDQWEVLQTDQSSQSWAFLGLVSLQTHLYALGGEQNGSPVAQNIAFQAIYTIMIPILP